MFKKRSLTNFILVVAVIIIALVQQTQPHKSSVNISPTTSVTTPAQLVKVARVIDGDTIVIDTDQKVRYIGIDTPELHDPRKPVQCFAQEAFEKNKELIEGKTVRLEKDVSETDKYGRLLRYVFLDKPATAEPVFVNEYLVKEGFAHVATFPPDVKYENLFLQDQQDARLQNKGLWKNCE